MTSKTPIIIIDYDLGNIASVLNMIRYIGGEARISASPDEIKSADKLILPGVGSFDAGMTNLKERRLDKAILDSIKIRKAMILGICLGMQLLMESSQEGTLPGLALVPGKVKKFQVLNQGLRIPHMGWNIVKPKGSSILFQPDQPEQRFYFVHSYYADCSNEQDISATTNYGFPFTSAFEHERILGVQFHPEKSHKYGMELLRKFIEA